MMKYDLKYDFHTHVLPGIDDGARDLPASLSMLYRLQAQGIDTVVATPHFYAHRQEAAQFLENRAAALAAVKSAGDSLPTVLPAAEVYLERGLRDIDLRPFCMEGTHAILVEMPYARQESWMLEEVYHFCLTQSLTPVFAHLDRYLELYSKQEIQEILDFDDAVIQVNNSAFLSRKSLKAVLGWVKGGASLLLGSDCHNLDSRAPNHERISGIVHAKLGDDWLADYHRRAAALLSR